MNVFDWFKKKSSKEEYDTLVAKNEKVLQEIYQDLCQMKQIAEKYNFQAEYNDCLKAFNEMVEIQNQLSAEAALIENFMDVHLKKLESIASNKKPIQERFEHKIELLEKCVANKLKELNV